MKAMRFLCLGNDRRQEYLAEILKGNGYQVTKLNNCEDNEMVKKCLTTIKPDCLLLPVAGSQKQLEKLDDAISGVKIIFGCNFSKDFCHRFKNIKFVNYMKLNNVAKKNAVATAEGVIAFAISNSDINLEDSKTLIAGFGTCGEKIAEKFRKMGSSVTVTARNEKTKTKVWLGGHEFINLKDLKSDRMQAFNYIVNTIPAKVFTDELLNNLNVDTTIIDVASAPGGVDFDFCRNNDINATLLPGIPGKYAPKTSAYILADALEEYTNFENNQEE